MDLSGRIRILARETADRIAAGEVVERPASVVKELLENALDAGATEIVVEIEKGGTKAIKITDNGSGIDRQDVEAAFERHATSKISGFDDLYEVRSYGFRGEALPSIAAVSRVEIVTREKDDLSGMRVRVEFGKVTERMEVGCPAGTTVSVQDLFGNVLVRRKFLKKESVEQGQCLDVVSRTVLPHARVRVRVTADGKLVLHIPAVEEMSGRISLALGLNVRDQMVPVSSGRGKVAVTGFVSRPEVTRSAAKGILCYVNDRNVRDPLVTHALMTAYRRLIEARRYPQAVLFIHLPPGEVDVNVHPAKLEVRFRNPREVYEAVLFSVVGALSKIAAQTGKPGAETTEGPPEIPLPIPYYQSRMDEAMRRFADQKIVREQRGLWEETRREPGKQEIAGFFSSLEYLGEFERTYLLFAGTGGVVVLDQHAAHERILFEKLRRAAEGGTVPGQKRLIPEVITLSPGNLSLLEQASGVFKEMGIDVEPFGGSTVRVHSFPALLSHLDPSTVLSDLLEELAETGRPPSVKEFRETLLTVMACKGAVKAHESLSRMEVAEICRELDSIPHAATCPHGRPLYIEFRLKDLERMFKRS